MIRIILNQLNHLPDLVQQIAMKMYTLADQAISKGEIKLNSITKRLRHTMNDCFVAVETYFQVGTKFMVNK